MAFAYKTFRVPQAENPLTCCSMHIKLYPVASSLFISKDYANVNYIMVRNYITEKPFVIYVEKKKGGGGG